MSLSHTKQRIYDFIRGYASSNHGQTPTIAEIGAHIGLSSPASVYDHLRGLESLGLITRVPNVSRGTRLVEQPVNPS